ncbi:MAG: choice-of-anchor L domain-containing protein [Crocinitomicaceae bacterium]|nr:choice-of-anchor L domain-containing protein [Crocinitomicaceae bacterium]
MNTIIPTSLQRIFVLFALISPFTAVTQLNINNAVNATDGVQNVLLGTGVTVSNISFVGSSDQIASFNCSNCNLGIQNGLVMSTGNASNAAGPNYDGSISTDYFSTFYDPDLSAISAVTVHDAAVLQFDFVPNGNMVTFNFVFGSDEYPEYTNSSFNDSFGFFISGPGISGPYQNQAQNIALIPGTSIPVSINNLNNGYDGLTGPCEYCANYIYNGDGYSAPYSGSPYYIQPDGFTTVLQATSPVQCGQTYHIKLAIGDGADGIYDSWVFLEGGSFQSNSLGVSFDPSLISPGQDAVYEGCLGASVTFQRPTGATGDVLLTIASSGTAQNGIDYDAIPDHIFIPTGQDQVVLPLNVIEDGIADAGETITFDINYAGPCATSTTLTLTIHELPALTVTSEDLLISCTESARIDLSISGGYGQYSVEWDGVPGTTSLDVPNENAVYNYVVTDVCNIPQVSGSVTVELMQYDPISVGLPSSVNAVCLSPLDISPTNVSGGDGNYGYQWSIDGVPYSTSSTFSWPTPTPSTVTLEVTDACGATSSASTVISVPPVPVVVTLGPDIQSTCFDSETSSATSVTGGSGTLSYVWTYNGAPAGTNSSVTVVAGAGGTLQLTVNDQCGNSDSDELIITVPPIPVTVSVSPDTGICPGESAPISGEASGGAGTFTYSWSSGQSSSGITVSPGVTTTYVLTATDQCGNSGSEDVVVTVFIQEVPFEVADTSICLGVSTGNINFGGYPPYSISYDTDSLVFESGHGFSGLLIGPSLVTIEDQCGGYSDFILTVNDCQILIPNVFTPNGDDENQYFVIDGLLPYFKNSKLHIYNRWGGLVFESANYGNDWDGDDLSEGTYFYIFERSDGEISTGNVTLLKK